MNVVVKCFVALLWCAACFGCGRGAELVPCNIAEETCQEDVYYAVLRLRGDGWDPFDGVPPIRTITLEQYKAELTPDPPAEPSEPSEPSEPPEIDPWDVALRWLGLVTPTMTTGEAAISNRVNNVAAYYSSGEQRVTVIDRGGEHNDRGDTQLLAHELVHAFQDNELYAVPVDHTTDGDFAGRSYIEGEARLYEHLAAAELDRVAPQALDWHAHYSRQVDHLRTQLAQQSSPFYAVTWFVYDLGADMLMGGWLEGGNAAVRQLAETFPRSAVGFMARHERMELGSAPKVECDVEPPDEKFELRGYDRFGAMQLYAFMAGSEDMHEPDAWRAALDWRDDLLWLYLEPESEQVVLSWRIRLASAGSADTVVEVARQLPNLRAHREGNDAVIIGSEPELQDWVGAADCER